ncbi:MAG: hypothetical protein R3B45_11970 [Bdellovibrionota bacterium]
MIREFLKKSREAGGAILPILVTFSVFGMLLAILSKQNVDLLQMNRKRTVINDVKDIRNGFDHIIDCGALMNEIATGHHCGNKSFIQSFFPVQKYDGSVLIKVPDNTGYSVLADHYILSARCTSNGYLLLAAAKILKSQSPPSSFTNKAEYEKFEWYNLFEGRTVMCGELPYYQHKIKNK